MPGCGLAVYALLLLAMGTVGAVGLVLASMALLKGDGTRPTELMSGTSVETWRLAPLYKSGALPPGEVPSAWHDESAAGDGSRVCALTRDAALRLEDGKATRLTYTALSTAEASALPDGSTAVRLTTPEASFSCLFGKDDGGVRFLRQVQTEMVRSEAGQSPSD